jgi:hypothetical protein
MRTYSPHWRANPQMRRSSLSASQATLGRSLSRQFELSIGCVPFRLHLSDEQLLKSASARYGAFTADEAPSFPIHLDNSASRDAEDTEFTYVFEGATLHATSGGSNFTGVRNEYALDSLLRIQLSWMLLSRSGFLLHAATIIRNGKAYVFTGRSGAGKSTVASLSPAGSVLTDEISLLRRDGGVWRAYGTPFLGEFRAAGSNSSAPIAAILRLLQAPENRVMPLRPMEVLRTILPNVLFFSTEPDANRRLLEILSQAATEISGHNLAFRKDRTFWEVVPA